MNWEVFGLIAGGIAVSSFIPQIIKGYKTKKLEDLSYLLAVFFSIGMLMWVIYGFHIKSLSVTISNFVGLCFSSILLGMKYYYSKKGLKVKECNYISNLAYIGR